LPRKLISKSQAKNDPPSYFFLHAKT